jgi:hypothetical protein
MYIDPCMKCRDLPVPLCADVQGRRNYEALAAGYLKSGRSIDRVIGHGAAFECVWTMTLDAPDEALDFIHVALDYAENEKQEAFLAAGALESLLVRHGPVVIERVLVAARSNPKLRRCLLGVWGFSGMDKTVRQRLDDLRTSPSTSKKKKR